MESLTRKDRIIGRAHGQELRMVQLAPRRGQAAGRIYVSTGVHGDEPASIAAIRWLLECRSLPRWMRPFHWTIFPCVNPAGALAGTRSNPDGLDLNRQFRRNDLPEISAIKRAVRGQRFDLCLHLHEDYDGTGFYLYELNRNEDWMGEEIVRAVKEILPVDRRRIIERRPANRGVIRRRPQIHRRKLWPEALWVFGHLTDHAITTETPSGRSLSDRVQAQLKVLEVAANWLAKRKDSGR